MTLEASVLRDTSLRRTDEGYEVDVHLAWYRSLPVSCLEDISVSIDGQAVASDSIRVLRGSEVLKLGELAGRVDDEWFVQDPLTLAVPSTSPLPKGHLAELEVTLATRIPYIIIGPQTALMQKANVKRKVAVQ